MSCSCSPRNNRFPFNYRAPGFPQNPFQFGFPCIPDCNNSGCPIILDSACVIYHKSQNSQSQLKNLNLPNGSTLQLILETIDANFGYINILNYNIPFLKSLYTITNLIQFGNAVDEQLELLTSDVIALQSGSTLSSSDTESIDIDLSGPFNNHISADLNVSGSAGNRLTILPDGAFVAPQSLIPDYLHFTLQISDGNTVDFGSILNVGWKGNVTSDPSSPPDGSYWYRTDSGQLKIQLNGATRIVTIT